MTNLVKPVILLRRATVLSLLLFTLAVLTSAQTNQNATTTTAPSSSSTLGAPSPINQTSANEDFELNIADRRITEQNYEASTEAATANTQRTGLSLRVGACVAAESIDVLLRNVRGRVRFRATLEPVLRRLNMPRAQPPVTAP